MRFAFGFDLSLMKFLFRRFENESMVWILVFGLFVIYSAYGFDFAAQGM